MPSSPLLSVCSQLLSRCWHAHCSFCISIHQNLELFFLVRSDQLSLSRWAMSQIRSVNWQPGGAHIHFRIQQACAFLSNCFSFNWSQVVCYFYIGICLNVKISHPFQFPGSLTSSSWLFLIFWLYSLFSDYIPSWLFLIFWISNRSLPIACRLSPFLRHRRTSLHRMNTYRPSVLHTTLK